MTQDFAFVQPTPPAQQTAAPAAPPPATAAPPGAVVPSNVVPTVSETEITPQNAAQVLGVVTDIVRRLIEASHISEDEKRQHHAALIGSVKVETPEEKQAREEKEAKRAELQRQLAELQ
jgi:hypothetical protein